MPITPSTWQTTSVGMKRASDPNTWSLSSLGAAITDTSGTSVTLNTGSYGRVLPGDIIRVDSEQMFVTSMATNVCTVVRGYGSTAATHANAAVVWIISGRVAGLETGYIAPDGAWPKLTVRGGAMAASGLLQSSAGITNPRTSDMRAFGTIAVSELGQHSIPSQSVPAITETADWSFVKLSYAGMFDISLSRLTSATLLETSQTSLRMCGGTVMKRTTNGTLITETAAQLVLPKYVAWHEATGYKVALLTASTNLSAMDQPWIMVWWGSQSHWLDATIPLNYSHRFENIWQTFPQRYAFQADCPLLLTFSANPTAITQTGGVGGFDLTLPAGAKKISTLPLYGRLRQTSATTEGWGASADGSAIPTAAKTAITAWYPRMQEFPARVDETYSYNSGTDTATITETITWNTVRAGGIKYAPISPIVGTARDTSLPGLTFAGVVVDNNYPTEYGPALGIVGVNSYSWSLAGLRPYTNPRAVPGGGAIPATVTDRLNTEVDKLVAGGHWSPWFHHTATPTNAVGGEAHWTNPADTIALVSELVPLTSGTRRTNLISWLTTERTTYAPETTYRVTAATGTNREQGVPNSKGDVFYDWSHPQTFSYRVWLWHAWALARYYQETGASLSGLNLATSFLATGGTLDQDMAEQDWATGHWFVRSNVAFGVTQDKYWPNTGDRLQAVENANRHWAGLAGLAWLCAQKADTNEGLVRCLLAKATITRVAMAHLPRWQAARNLITIPSDLGSAQANAEWEMTLTGNFLGFIHQLSWTSSADDPRQVVKLNQYEAFLDDSNHRWGYHAGAPRAHQPPYRFLPRPLATLLQAAVGTEHTIYARTWAAFQPQWWMPYVDDALGTEHGIPTAADAHGLFLAHAWNVGSTPATLERWTAYPWLDGGDLYYMSKLAETARIYSEGAPATGPQIGTLTDNRTSYAGNVVPTNALFEITIPITTTATELDLPYDPTVTLANLNTTRGITVDILLSKDNWFTTYTLPCFHYKGYTTQVISARDFIYPDGTEGFKARVSFPSTGTWKYRIQATAADGTAITADSDTNSITAVTSASHGFVKVSPTDSRYFEYADGTWAPCLAIGDAAAGVNKLSPSLDTIIPQDGLNKLQCLRVWFSSIGAFAAYASPWRSWWKGGDAAYSGLNNINWEGYTSYLDHDVSLNLWGSSTPGSGNTNEAFSYGETLPGLNLKLSTTYRVTVRFLMPDPLTAYTAGVPHGFTVKVHTSFIANPWLSTSVGTTVFPPVTDSPRVGGVSQWSTVSGSFTTGTGVSWRWPVFLLVLQNTTGTGMWVDEIMVQEDLGGGNFGPNIMAKGKSEMHKYVSQDAAFRIDQWVRSAETNGVTLKAVLSDTNDTILTGTDLNTGAWVGGLNADNFYGYTDGNMSKTRWLLRAWWRYCQARWGYSSAIHSWELLNEGDPNNARHFRLTNDFADYMHSFTLNRHMATTSTWFSIPESNFWANVAYPSPDYVDFHQYTFPTGANLTVNHPGGPVSVPLPADNWNDSAREHTFLASQVGPTKPAGVPGKPIMRAETAFLAGSDTNVPTTLTSSDTAGIWYHKWMWAQVHSGAVHEMPFHANNQVYASTAPVHDYRPAARRFYNWISQFPVSNGHYVEMNGACTDTNVQVYGQTDTFNGRFHGWCTNGGTGPLDTTAHNWTNVIQGRTPTARSGSITVPGLVANTTYFVTWRDPYTEVDSAPVSLVANGSGVLTIPFQTNLSTDRAFSGASQSAPPGPGGPATNVVGTPGSSQITVSWTPPTDWTTGITSYEIETTNVTTAIVSTQFTPNVSSYVVTGLSSANTYTFRVRAYSGTIVGGWSLPSLGVSPMAFGQFVKDMMLNWLKGSDASTAPATIYWSLHTADPGKTGASEITTVSTGYARRSMATTTGFSAIADGTGTKRRITNSGTITFNTPTGNWGTATYCGAWSASTGGDFYGSGALSVAAPINVPQAAPSFAIGQLAIDVD